jgi:hypothetical protein
VAFLTGKPYELWTFVNKSVKEQFTLFKVSKSIVYGWLNKFNPIYATMESTFNKNIEWTKRIGFKENYNRNGIIKLILERG